ncbi:hypothetical protein M2459_001102 [Parabacteroides sp. PF5-5]|nr:hypothetical protein [Parabacteroides sp. PH5-39]MDH6315478.1 hypothetical protein [Parabacteroides sp. PF5-13]MDH6319028.1 hypothetical protein [Parabacteroides sp. PH5-13]MDH6322758.1 hypothetical protein [Parabacteroides sp. PH5-8]MDH6326670.1 hypothetical protein [Parabacteroides sp. PH5-41]MDH6334360.1 hypothetical protein [Parabacteroides sp. PF5-5]MDH6345535.1 hypothetical protein [Parabacteroides sp. PH5-46]MDH6360491.1 hypothetical protein [Parabacteroides sp. PH5-16]MDH6376048.
MPNRAHLGVKLRFLIQKRPFLLIGEQSCVSGNPQFLKICMNMSRFSIILV